MMYPANKIEASSDFLFAVYSGEEKITEEMYQEVLDFAAYVTELDSQKRPQRF